MAKRKGQHLEDFTKRFVSGKNTVNSGAMYEDADHHAGGFGGRIYECKSSSIQEGIKITSKDVNILMQRANKLLKTPVFLFENKHNTVWAIVPTYAFEEAMIRVCHSPDKIRKVTEQLAGCPTVGGKGGQIKVNAKTLGEFNKRFVEIFTYKRHTDKTTWVICPAFIFLDLAGDLKEGKKWFEL